MIKLGRIKLKINEIVLPAYEDKEKDKEKLDNKTINENKDKDKDKDKNIKEGN